MKRGLFVVFVLFCVLGFCLKGVYGLTSVSPASYKFNFQPGLKQDFVFNVYGDKPDTKYNIYLDGDLSEYAKASAVELVGGGQVIVSVKLPRSIETPGQHRVVFGAREVPDKEGGLGVVVDLRGVIVVDVPYPGKYALVDFEPSDANAGENVKFKLEITSKGDEKIFTTSVIDIYDSENEKIDSLNLGVSEVASQESVELEAELDSEGLDPGNYKAVARVLYGGENDVEIEKEFRLGELFVDIESYTEVFERDKVNPIYVNVQSFWNDPISGVYVSGTVEGKDISFKTPSEDLKPWEIKPLLGYIDTSGIEGSRFKARLIVNYANKTNERIVSLRFKRNVNYVVIGLVGGLLLVVILLVWLYVKFRRLKNAKKRR